MTEPGVASWDAQERARALLKQDEAREQLRRLTEPQMTPMGGDSELRERALAQARLDLGAERLGVEPSGGEPMVLANGAMTVVRRKDGLISEMRAGVVEETTVLPHQWEEHERVWQARRRRGENEILARYWGRDRCVLSGFFTAAEAAELPPDPPRGPGGAPYRLEDSVA